MPKKKTAPKPKLRAKSRFELAAPCPRCGKVFDEKDTVAGLISRFDGPYSLDGKKYQTLENVCLCCHECEQRRVVKFFIP